MKKAMVYGLGALVLVMAQTRASAADNAYFGAMMAPLTANVQRDLAIRTSKGAAIGDVVPGSPAAGAGLKGDDVIIDIDGQAVGSPQDVVAIIGRHQPGDRIAVQILQSSNGHRPNTVRLTLGARPSGFRADRQPGPQPVPVPARP